MLVHYVFVRSDLPVGVIAAMTAHAAGTSARIESAFPGVQSLYNAKAIILNANSEADLISIWKFLTMNNIVHQAFVENGGPYIGQLMSIGLKPISDNSQEAKKLSSYGLLKTCLDNQPAQPLDSGSSNAQTEGSA
jgi:hypothetical protein